MKIRYAVCFIIFISFSFGHSQDGRRLGKLAGQDWEVHASIGKNDYPYQSSEFFPDFSPVGALIGENGTLGTATLIAPNTVITAAHVVKNSYNDSLPDPKNWEFVLSSDYESADSAFRFSVAEIAIHPHWIARQSKQDPLGDGDKMGVDMALLRLEDPVPNVTPVRLPYQNSPYLGQKIFVSGFGNLVDGATGDYNPDNFRRMAGTNALDRVVREIVIGGHEASMSGGLLAFDFDAPRETSNTLGDSFGAFENLPVGSSGSFPLEFEVSTAEGDSGGPLIARVDDHWRIFGTVSYGSSDSTYGDITVFSRIYNQLDWIYDFLPSWPECKLLSKSGWMESDWFGVFLPFSSGWNFHVDFGWLWSKPTTEDSVWIYIDHIGWLWVSRSTFPFFYSDHLNQWFYFFNDSDLSGRWKVYDFANLTWSDYSI